MISGIFFPDAMAAGKYMEVTPNGGNKNTYGRRRGENEKARQRLFND